MIAVRWCAVTILAYSAAATLSVFGMSALVRPLGAVLDGMAFIVVFGAVFGLTIGAVQLLGARREWPRAAWLLTTTLGGGVGYALTAIVGERLGDAVSPTGNIVIGGAAIQCLSGATLGLGIGLAQWRVTRRLGIGRSWVIATSLGVSLAYGAAAAVLELLEIQILKANLIPSYGAILGLGAGIGQAIILRSPLTAGAPDRVPTRRRPR